MPIIVGRVEAELKAERLSRLVNAREMAKALEIKNQEKYREAMIIRIEEEVAQKKKKWEAQRSSQLEALRTLYAQSLTMIGEGQKEAVDAIENYFEGARDSAAAWQEVAAATVNRGQAALIEDAEDRTRKAMKENMNIYRQEVTKAIADFQRDTMRHEREKRSFRSSNYGEIGGEGALDEYTLPEGVEVPDSPVGILENQNETYLRLTNRSGKTQPKASSYIPKQLKSSQNASKSSPIVREYSPTSRASDVKTLASTTGPNGDVTIVSQHRLPTTGATDREGVVNVNVKTVRTPVATANILLQRQSLRPTPKEASSALEDKPRQLPPVLTSALSSPRAQELLRQADLQRKSSAREAAAQAREKVLQARRAAAEAREQQEAVALARGNEAARARALEGEAVELLEGLHQLDLHRRVRSHSGGASQPGLVPVRAGSRATSSLHYAECDGSSEVENPLEFESRAASERQSVVQASSQDLDYVEDEVFDESELERRFLSALGSAGH